MPRDATGKYALELTNDAGACSASFDLTVQGEPGEVSGPVRASDITKHNCTLSWRPPKDDGGAKVTHYMVEKMEKGKDKWVPVSSFCKDTTFTVQGLTPDAEYSFRVSAVNDIGQGQPLSTETSIIAKMPFGKSQRRGAHK